MSYFYCTCSKDLTKRNAVENGRTPFREVEVDREGVCLDCGHYAVQYFERIDPKRSKLYDKLFDEGKDPPPEKVKGGLSLYATEVSERRKKRGSGDESGEGEDGDLDV